MIQTLTNRSVASLRFAGRPQNIADRKVHGLTLRVGARSKIWYFIYRNNGPSQWLKLGEYPSLSLEDARTRATDERAVLLNGSDPVAEHRKALEPEPEPAPKTAAFTFADFVPAFMAFQKGRKKTWSDDQTMIDRYLAPAWNELPLRDITRTRVHEVLDATTGKGLTIGVNRLQALISRIFTVAVDRGLIDAHPASRVLKRFKEQPRNRVLTDTELRTLWDGLDALPGAASDAVRLRLLLGQRGEETAGMLWSELDLDAPRWSLDGTRTKNRRPHVVGLPPTALALLRRRRAIVPDDEPRVFPVLQLTSDAHKALTTIHSGAYEWIDLRRTVATRLADLGFDETTIGRVLNHAKITITSRHYNKHEYVDEIRQALTVWDAELQRILANQPREQTRVLPMRRRS